jgi:hypothetical protein
MGCDCRDLGLRDGVEEDRFVTLVCHQFVLDPRGSHVLEELTEDALRLGPPSITSLTKAFRCSLPRGRVLAPTMSRCSLTALVDLSPSSSSCSACSLPELVCRSCWNARSDPLSTSPPGVSFSARVLEAPGVSEAAKALPTTVMLSQLW